MKKIFSLNMVILLGASTLLGSCGDDFNISPCRKGEHEHHHDGCDKNKPHHEHDSTVVNTPAPVTQPGS
jgi:hypothetical protein